MKASTITTELPKDNNFIPNIKKPKKLVLFSVIGILKKLKLWKH